jgi:hypothetical protein
MGFSDQKRGHPGAPRGAKTGSSCRPKESNYFAAILLAASNRAEVMPESDWRSPESYKSLEDAAFTDIAWEWLPQNADYWFSSERDLIAELTFETRRCDSCA